MALSQKGGLQSSMRSVPPRGSGWVRSIAFENLASVHPHQPPPRSRVVLLTSCHVDTRVLRQKLTVIVVFSGGVVPGPPLSSLWLQQQRAPPSRAQHPPQYTRRT